MNSLGLNPLDQKVIDALRLGGGRLTVPQLTDYIYPDVPKWDRTSRYSVLYHKMNTLQKFGYVCKEVEGKKVYWKSLC